MGNKTPMAYIYEAMDRVKETIERAFGGVKKQHKCLKLLMKGGPTPLACACCKP